MFSSLESTPGRLLGFFLCSLRICDKLKKEYTKWKNSGLKTASFKKSFCGWVALGGPALIPTHSAATVLLQLQPHQHNCHTPSYTIRAGLLQNYDSKKKTKKQPSTKKKFTKKPNHFLECHQSFGFLFINPEQQQCKNFTEMFFPWCCAFFRQMHLVQNHHECF